MSLVTSTLRPGLLVSLKTSCRGNVKYERVDLETSKQLSKWETTRHVANVEEAEKAELVRREARAMIAKVCTVSAFGYLCPEENADILAEAISAARAYADNFNKTATLSHVHVYVMTGRVASDDVEAVRAISSEVRDLMDTMAEGVEKMEVEKIRTAAAKAKEVSGMLTDKAQASVQIAVDQARAVATQIQKAVKAGETAALQIDKAALRKIKSQRTAFLDFSEEVEVTAPKATARAIELETEDASKLERRAYGRPENA